eukprot:TRINITY_DN64538_c0_g1_i1.p1 TRINITY_DN64538_c0_g1~~TRINITY_DN64538_c0_g1_i1.p1  ORF type:complete len:233 (-),score=13.85 TRINITY_DN64538_c0_g1_i1:486-1118(-)
MALFRELRLVIVVMLGACVDCWLCAVIPLGRGWLAELAIALVVVIIQFWFTSFILLLMKLTLGIPVPSNGAQAVLMGAWFLLTVFSMALTFQRLEGEIGSSEARVIVLLFLRLADIFVLSGAVAYLFPKDGRDTNFEEYVRARALCLRLRRLNALKYLSAEKYADASNLFCCQCLYEFSRKEEIVVFPCKHVAHALCVHTFFARRPARGE